jgi:hypothetical protein
MKILKRAILTLAVLPVGLALGAVQLDFSFTPTLDSGTDPHGLTNSTWSFTMVTEQDNYIEDVAIAYAPAESTTLNISGSTDLDGTYALTELVTGQFMIQNAHSFQLLILGTFSEYGVAAFDVGSMSVTNFQISSGVGAFDPALEENTPVLAERLDGITLTGSYAFDTDTGSFSIPDTTLNASVTITHVDADATGLDDGSSWSNAFTHLQDALAASTNQSELWVADGVYYPDETSTTNTDSQLDLFEVGEYVSLYGGFTGTETNRNDRYHVSQPTILSGDIMQDDITTDGVVTGDPETDIIGTNANSIIRLANTGAPVLDGFILTGAGYDTALGGAGLVHRCTFQGNLGAAAGAVYHSWGQMNLVDCDFINNRAYDAGAVRSENGDEITITSCTFKGNKVIEEYALYTAGAVRINGGNPVIANSLFSGNESGGTGGILYLYAQPGDIMTLKNCTITANLSTDDYGENVGGGLFGFQGGTIQVENCVIWGNSSVSNLNAVGIVTQEFSLVEGITAGGTNLDGNNPANDPLFVSSVPAALTTAGDYALSAGSPLINIGSNALATGTVDVIGHPRIVNGTVDLGAYEFIHSITNYDGDAFSNEEEYIADTDAADETDFFRIESVTNNTVHFNSSSSRQYTLFASTNLVDGIWTPVGTRLGTGGPDSLSGTNSVPNEFYKLEVAMP